MDLAEVPAHWAFWWLSQLKLDIMKRNQRRREEQEKAAFALRRMRA